MAAGVVEGREADLVDDDEFVAADGLDGFADGVVGQGAVEVFDEIDRPVWDGSPTDVPLMGCTTRSQPLKKIATPKEKLI